MSPAGGVSTGFDDGRRTDLARQEIAHAEGLDVTVGIALRQVRLEAQPEIHGQVRADAPRVLHVEPVVIRLVVVIERPALAERAELAGDEVGIAESGWFRPRWNTGR